jgi:hypothetical protein
MAQVVGGGGWLIIYSFGLVKVVPPGQNEFKTLS